MAAFTSIALAVTAAAAVAGAGMAAYGMYKSKEAGDSQAHYQQQAIQQQKKAEAARKQAMNLDAARRKREMIRQQVAANAQAQAVATNQGAAFGSGLPGAYGGISGRTNVNEAGVNQNLELGNKIFDANMKASDAYSSAAGAGSNLAFYQGLTSLGTSLMSSAGNIGQVGGFFFPAKA